MSEPDSGVVSSFQFVSYKIDDFNFSMKKDVSILSQQATFDGPAWDIGFTIQPPVYIKPNQVYVSRIGCKVALRPVKTEEPLATLEAFASGVFATKGEFTQAQEDALIKFQMPSILFPYLRGAVTSFFANAGFGSVIFPLINVNNLARDVLRDAKVQTLGEDLTSTDSEDKNPHPTISAGGRRGE